MLLEGEEATSTVYQQEQIFQIFGRAETLVRLLREWPCEATTTLGRVTEDFEKILALDDAIFGEIRAVNGTPYPISAEDRSDSVGVKFLGYCSGGESRIRDGNLRRMLPHL